MALVQTVHLSMANFKSAPVVPAVQNDSDRQVKMIIDDYTLTSGLTGKIAFERSDGTHYETAAELVLVDNAFVANIDQALTQPGRTMVQLKVTDTLTVSTFSFVIFVEADNSGTVTPQEGIDLVTAVAAAEDAADRAESAAETLELDATLTSPTKAAQAKAVGDEISEIKSATSETDKALASYSPNSTMGISDAVASKKAEGRYWYKSGSVVATAADVNFQYIVLPLSEIGVGILVHYATLDTDYTNRLPVGFAASDEIGTTVIDYLSVSNIKNGYHDITSYDASTCDCILSKSAILAFKPTTTHLWINLASTDYAKNVTFLLEQSVSEQLSSLKGGIPSFVKSAGDDAYQRIMTWANGDPITMIAQITDVHSAGTEKYKAVGYLNELNRLYGFDLIGNFGDIGLDTASETTANGWELIQNTKRLMDATSPWFYCKGNHDHGRVLMLANRPLDNCFAAPFYKQMHYTAETKGQCYGYIDLPINKIRVINVNTSDDKKTGGYDIGIVQLRWIVSALQSVVAGWNVVVVSHMCVDPCGRWNSYQTDASSDNFVAFREILESFVAKTAGSQTVGASTVTWDFTTVDPSCKLVCSFAGDSHFNNEAKTNGVQYIVRQGYGTISTSEMPSGATYDSFNYKTHCCFDVLCIKNDGNAGVFRIGVGGSTRDFIFTY